MYELPPDFDPNVLVGQTVEKVCFGGNFVALRFDTAELKVFGQLDLGDAVAWDEQQGVTDAAGIAALPTRVVSAASVEGPATLVLALDSGQTLRAVADSAHYECYWLDLGERRIIV